MARTYHGTTTGSKSGKEYVKAVYCPNYRKKKKKTTVKNINTWRLNHMLLNNQWIIEELKEEIIKCL